MEISAKADYGIRALAELAAVGGGPMKVVELADAQHIPPHFLQNILLQMRRRGVVMSQRGADGGYRLARPAAEISLADAIRAVEGPLAAIRGERPESVGYGGHAATLADAWVAMRVSVRDCLEGITLEQLVNGPLPPHVVEAVAAAGAWESR